ncbi:pilin [Pseudoalteromonas sp. SR41-6]|nr:pilin [Pseudoalteromonas sp. SR41-6]MBB1459637.1 pilin [Pseudoalteromonas sp. SG41-8]
MTQQSQKGFTLIELMIVVAIIGILAAVALPAYQDYTARAQASEAVSLTAGIKTGVAEFYQSEGGYPTADTTPALNTYTASGTYSSVALKANGVIEATMKGTGVSADLQSAIFTFTPSVTGGSFKWSCSHNLTNLAIAPKGCGKS